MKNKVEIVISFDQRGTLNIKAMGSAMDILTALTMAVIDITSNIGGKKAKELRENLCALVMAMPVKVDYTSKDLERIVAEPWNRVKGNKDGAD